MIDTIIDTVKEAESENGNLVEDLKCMHCFCELCP
jgi:hypothetical protein